MTDEEYNALRKKLYEEEQRRKVIKDLKNDLSALSKKFGLTFPNGWVSDLKTTVYQSYICAYGQDGNGPSTAEEITIEISEKDMKLLGSVMDALKDKINDILKVAKEKDYSYEEIINTVYYSKFKLVIV